MHSSIFYSVFLFLIYPAIISLPCLYIYPIIFGCAFPEPSQPQTACIFDKDAAQIPTEPKKVAPFRLLAFGDPQLEGDTSLPNRDDPLLPSVGKIRDLHIRHAAEHWNHNVGIIKGTARELVIEDIPRIFGAWRKRLDLLGNDYYLAHIYRATNWWLQPTHISVLGDLIGSQWVSDEEFEKRGSRFWKRVFRKGQKVPDHLSSNRVRETLGKDPGWSRRIINIAGNHDVGYAGDMTRHRLERFEKVFGKANYEIRFQLPQDLSNSSMPMSNFFGSDPPQLRLVVLNSMNLDAPALDPEMQQETYRFINDDVINQANNVEDRRTATIVLTHIPLYKQAGVCEDGPFFANYDSGLIREQNHLSLSASRNILEGIIGMSADKTSAYGGHGRKSIIINGHDHEGCRTYHYIPTDAVKDDGREWQAVHRTLAQPLIDDSEITGTEEITLRSMMGSFGGNAGLLSAWFDEEVGEWQFDFDTCPFVVQHIWWAVHIFVLITLLIGLTGVFVELLEVMEKRKISSDARSAKLTGERVKSEKELERKAGDVHGKTEPRIPKAQVK